jgi:hypothetical protein
LRGKVRLPCAQRSTCATTERANSTPLTSLTTRSYKSAVASASRPWFGNVSLSDAAWLARCRRASRSIFIILAARFTASGAGRRSCGSSSLDARDSAVPIGGSKFFIQSSVPGMISIVFRLAKPFWFFCQNGNRLPMWRHGNRPFRYNRPFSPSPCAKPLPFPGSDEHPETRFCVATGSWRVRVVHFCRGLGPPK